MSIQPLLALKKFYWSIVLACAFIVIAYIANFFSPDAVGFSNDPDDWGVFGDYIGGTIGTFFAFAAFVAVLVTVAIQREQLDHARKQASLDELQRFLSNTAMRIDEMLHRELSVGQVLLLQRFANVTQRVTLLSLIASVGSVKAGMLDEGQVDHSAFQSAIEDIKAELPLLATDLEFLSICMRTYAHRGGDDDIVKLYRLRYNHVVGWLHIGGLSLNENIVSQFPVDEFVDQAKRLRKAKSAAAGA